MLNICPLMNVNVEGKLIPRDKYRGKKRVIREMVERMKEHAEQGAAYNGKCFFPNPPAPKMPRQWPAWWKKPSLN